MLLERKQAPGGIGSAPLVSWIGTESSSLRVRRLPAEVEYGRLEMSSVLSIAYAVPRPRLLKPPSSPKPPHATPTGPKVTVLSL